jgi:glycosyltransferase involved in cell wall biosynthesis
VHTYHGHIFHSYYGRWKTSFFLFVERTLARLATDRIVVISPQQLGEINGQFGVGRREQFAVVPLGLDTGAFAQWAGRRELLRREWGARGRDVLIGIVGRLTEIKNHKLFLEAAALFKSKHAASVADGGRVGFVVIGDGHLRAELEAHALSLGLCDDVIFTGLRDDPENFYPALDVVALTSLNEGTPLTLIEAMANARPCVATAVGGVVDLLGGIEESELRRAHRWRTCERGASVQPGDAEAFAEALAHLVADETLRASMGERGREFVERDYSVGRLVEDVLHLYEDLTGALVTPQSADDEAHAARGSESHAPRHI